MVIYADILFLVNFIMDCFSLYICAKVQCLKVSVFRLLIAGIIGGVYGTIHEIVSLPEPICSAAVSAIMIFIALNITSPSSFIKSAMLFYTVSMLLGGIMTALQNFFYTYGNSHFFSGGLSFGHFAVLVVICMLLTAAAARLFSSAIMKKTITAEFSVHGGKTVSAKLLCDTGNVLRDPYSDLPVIVVKSDIVKKLAGADAESLLAGNYDADCASAYRLRFISAKTVGGNTVLAGFGAIKTYFIGKNGKKSEASVIVAADTLSDFSCGGCDGIVPYTAVWGL